MSRLDDARYARQNRLNPAEYAPGQEESFNMFDENNNDIFGGAPQGGSDLFGGSNGAPQGGSDLFGNNGGAPQGGSDLFGNTSTVQGGNLFGNNLSGNTQGFGGFGNGNAMNAQTANQASSAEEHFYNAMKASGTASLSFFKQLVQSFKGVTPLYWQSYGFLLGKVSLGSVIFGVICLLFRFSIWSGFLVGGLLSMAAGVALFLINSDEASEYDSMYANTKSEPEPPTEDNNSFFDESAEEDYSFLSDDGDDDIFGGDSDYDEDEDDDFFPDEDDAWDVDSYVAPAPPMSSEDALGAMQEIPQGMYTRQYLYDAFNRILPSMRPDFERFTDFDEDSDEFMDWCEWLRDAAEVSGSKQDYLPELLTLKKSLFTIVLTCDRPTGFKPEAVSRELSNIYAHKDGYKNEGVYATFVTVGKECIITIFTGKSEMVSLKDMLSKVEPFILDSKNYMPVVFGIDQAGKVIHCDLKKLESIIITGMPRSGKSWFVQAVLTQMCAYVSPKELNIIICDPKEGISDFKAFTLPHVKEFQTKDDSIVNVLRHLVKVEAPRRKKIIGDAGFVNIWDYKERYPDVELPIIYALIDEVVTLASRMDKETFSEFKMLLRELISQLPALGIRAFLIPHILNNEIIEKKTSDLVPCKVSVCGDADHIEKATGAKPRDFTYKLVNKGDMAMRIPLVSSSVLYVHGAALTDSNVKNNELFDYMRRVWSKLEPEEVKGSIAQVAQEEKELQEVVHSIAPDNNVSDGGLSFEDIEPQWGEEPNNQGVYDLGIDNFF